jgi:hypothetical protein
MDMALGRRLDTVIRSTPSVGHTCSRMGFPKAPSFCLGHRSQDAGDPRCMYPASRDCRLYLEDAHVDNPPRGHLVTDLRYVRSCM